MFDIISNAALNNFVYMPFCTCMRIPWDKIPEVGLLGQRICEFLILLEISQLLFTLVYPLQFIPGGLLEHTARRRFDYMQQGIGSWSCIPSLLGDEEKPFSTTTSKWAFSWEALYFKEWVYGGGRATFQLCILGHIIYLSLCFCMCKMEHYHLPLRANMRTLWDVAHKAWV